MKETTAAHFEKARNALHAARLLLNADEAEGAINRAYYAAFHAASAALFEVGEAPKTHSGMQRRFWMRYVEPGHLSTRHGGFLSHAQELREQADYEAVTDFDTAAAADLLRDAEAFVEAVESVVRKLDAGA